MKKIDLSEHLIHCYWQSSPLRRKILGDHRYKKKIIFDSPGFIFFRFNKDVSDEQLTRIRNCPIVSDLIVKPTFISFVIVIPVNFICDSTSLPWADDICGDLHDCGYGIQGSKYGFTKAFWDKCYKLSMEYENFPPTLIFTRYNGVRMFGGKAYKDRRNEKYGVIRHKALSDIINKMGV